MRNLKIFLTVAAAGVLFTSCYERQFTPTLGSTPVEFVSSTAPVPRPPLYSQAELLP